MSEFNEYLKRPVNAKLAGSLKKVIWILTAVVLITVGLMRRVKFDIGVDMTFLPPIHALLNTLVAVSLIMAVWMIKKKNVTAHKRWISFAMLCSVLFLLGYVSYHFTTPETTYPKGEPLRGLYFFVLITHIVLAGISLPFILYTWMFGATNQFQKHRKLARWVFPIWLYVAITGPVCYFMLEPYY